MLFSSTRFSPKVIRKQVEVSPKEYHIDKKYGVSQNNKNLKKVTAHDRNNTITKESEVFPEIAK